MFFIKIQKRISNCFKKSDENKVPELKSELESEGNPEKVKTEDKGTSKK